MGRGSAWTGAYGQLRALGLSAQPAVRVIKKVADAYKLDRRTKRTFRADAAQPYDDRCLSWQPDQQTVSIWTVAGRLKGIRFAVGEQQRKLLASTGTASSTSTQPARFLRRRWLLRTTT